MFKFFINANYNARIKGNNKKKPLTKESLDEYLVFKRYSNPLKKFHSLDRTSLRPCKLRNIKIKSIFWAIWTNKKNKY